MLIHTNTHTGYTHLTEQCSVLYQRLSHTAVMGHSAGSHFVLFFSIGQKQEVSLEAQEKHFWI